MFVVTEHNRGALALRQSPECAPQSVALLDRTIGPWVGDLRCDRAARSLEVRALHLPTPEVRTAEVDDHLAEIGVKRCRVPQMDESSGEADEGGLDEVLGEGEVPGQQVGEADGIIGVPKVEVAELSPVRRGKSSHVLGQHLVITDSRRAGTSGRFHGPKGAKTPETPHRARASSYNRYFGGCASPSC